MSLGDEDEEEGQMCNFPLSGLAAGASDPTKSHFRTCANNQRSKLRQSRNILAVFTDGATVPSPLDCI